MKRTFLFLFLIFCTISINSQDIDKLDFNIALKFAQQGKPIVQTYVGMCYMGYMDGGVEKDEQEGFKWLMKAAQQGYAQAQVVVGQCYSKGQGTTKDEYKSFEWYMKAAQQGNALGQSMVGLCYLKGIGTDKDETKAFELFLKASKQNLPFAYCELACCYMQGKGVSLNKDMAWEYLNKALVAEPQNPQFMDTKGEFYSIEGNVKKAFETWDDLNRISPSYYSDKETAFSKYIKNLKSDNIDSDVPTIESTNKNAFAVIVANENYQDVDNVSYAINDGTIFAEYCGKTFGIPNTNIRFLKDATLNNIRKELLWLKQVLDAYGNDATVLFYYAGHGIPDDTGKTSYLLPIDGIGSDATTGYNLNDLFSSLGNLPAKHITVFLDACFSGANREGGMLASTRGVAIKAKQTAPTGNMVVFSAAQEDETAWPYNEKQNGLFTYFLLKKIKESNGDVPLGELGDYVTTEVKKQSIVTNRKSQTPVVCASLSLGSNWESWTLK